MAESFRFSVGAMGESSGPSRINRAKKEICLQDALIAIRNLPVSDEQKELLFAKAKKVPNGCLHNFLLNYKSHLKKD